MINPEVSSALSTLINTCVENAYIEGFLDASPQSNHRLAAAREAWHRSDAARRIEETKQSVGGTRCAIVS